MSIFILIWIVGLLGECVPVIRAMRGGFIGHYKLFYVYLTTVLLRDACLSFVYFIWPKTYRPLYWSTEFLEVLIGCGLVWEVYKIALERYPGSARMARSLLALAFIFTFARSVIRNWDNLHWIPGSTTLTLELNLRVVQMALLVALVALFWYYTIPLGKNLRGIIYGYGLFLVTSLINLSLRQQLGASFQRVWQLLQPACYMLVLAVWIWSLWSYQPQPEPSVEPMLEADYVSFIQATRKKLIAARKRLAKEIRP